MGDDIVTLRNAKARLSELTERAAAGETIVIAKHGKPVARLSAPVTERKPVNLAALRKLTQAMPRQPEGAGRFLRRLRDRSRY